MAAGQGFKNFTTGDVLTAADTNGYLMQGVWVFADSAARTAAVTSPQEGNTSFLKDTNALEIYDGAAWVAYGSGDITGVTAGTGISGGGTSGAVTITNSMATAITTAGDLIKGTGSGTFDRLGIGSTGQVLTVSAGAPSWASPASGSLTQLASGTLSGSTVTLSVISQSYIDLVLVIRNGRCSVDDETIMGKINSVTSAYSTQSNVIANDVSVGSSALQFTNANDSSAADGLSVIEFFDYAQTLTWKLGSRVTINNNATTTTNMNWSRAGLLIKSTEAIGSIILTPSGGTLSGTYILYGRK